MYVLYERGIERNWEENDICKGEWGKINSYVFIHCLLFLFFNTAAELTANFLQNYSFDPKINEITTLTKHLVWRLTSIYNQLRHLLDEHTCQEKPKLTECWLNQW